MQKISKRKPETLEQHSRGDIVTAVTITLKLDYFITSCVRNSIKLLRCYLSKLPFQLSKSNGNSEILTLDSLSPDLGPLSDEAPLASLTESFINQVEYERARKRKPRFPLQALIVFHPAVSPGIQRKTDLSLSFLSALLRNRGNAEPRRENKRATFLQIIISISWLRSEILIKINGRP